MSMVRSPESDKPLILLFMDVDGVLFSFSEGYHRENNPHVQALFAPLKSQIDATPSLAWFIRHQALTVLFSKVSLNLLDSFTVKLEEAGYRVGFVISSSWRTGCGDLDMLERLLERHKFSKKIIGYTAHRADLIDPEVAIKLTRGEEIDLWLNEYAEELNPYKCLIFDDVDDGISALFKEQYVRCYDRLIDLDIVKAMELLRKMPPLKTYRAPGHLAKDAASAEAADDAQEGNRPQNRLLSTYTGTATQIKPMMVRLTPDTTSKYAQFFVQKLFKERLEEAEKEPVVLPQKTESNADMNRFFQVPIPDPKKISRLVNEYAYDQSKICNPTPIKAVW